MKLLFLSYHYPGPLEPLARWLAARGNEILFASIRSARVENVHIPGIRRAIVKHFSPLSGPLSYTNTLENGLRAARSCTDSLTAIRDSGFEPQIILNASSGGSALAIPDVFPGALWLNFLETDPFARQNPVQALQILKANLTYAFYPSQKACLPEALAPVIKSIRPMADTEFFTPPLKRKSEHLAVLSFHAPEVASSLLKEFLSASGANRAVLIAPNVPVMRILQNQFQERVDITLANTREERKELFSAATLALFDAPCLNLIECMACGCPAFVSPQSPKIDRPVNVVAYPKTGISSLLCKPQILLEYGSLLRKTAVAEYSLQTYMPGWFNSILKYLQPAA